MAKRTFLEMLASDDPSLWIKLPSGERLPAHREVLKWARSVVKALPPGAWDISDYVIEGRLVEKAVVVMWLAVIYPPVDNVEEPEQLPPLGDVLAFADAVGSSKAVIRVCYQRCPLNGLAVKIGEREVIVPLSGCLVYYSRSPANGGITLGTPSSVVGLEDGVSEQQFDSIRPQVATQLESLLHLAYKLQLDELQAQLHHFIHACSMSHASIFADFGLLETSVFTERVMEAVGKQQVKAAWIQSIVGMPAGKCGIDTHLCFEPRQGKELVHSFQATLRRPYMGAPAGTGVDCEFDLGRGTMRFKLETTSHTFPARIVLSGYDRVAVHQ